MRLAILWLPPPLLTFAGRLRRVYRLYAVDLRIAFSYLIRHQQPRKVALSDAALFDQVQDREQQDGLVRGAAQGGMGRAVEVGEASQVVFKQRLCSSQAHLRHGGKTVKHDRDEGNGVGVDERILPDGKKRRPPTEASPCRDSLEKRIIES